MSSELCAGNTAPVVVDAEVGGRWSADFAAYGNPLRREIVEQAPRHYPFATYGPGLRTTKVCTRRGPQQTSCGLWKRSASKRPPLPSGKVGA